MNSARSRARGVTGRALGAAVCAVALALVAAGCSKSAESRTEVGAMPASVGETSAVAAPSPVEPAGMRPIHPAGPAGTGSDPGALDQRMAAQGVRAVPVTGAAAGEQAAAAGGDALPTGKAPAQGGATRTRAETAEYVVQVSAPAKVASGAASTVTVTLVPKGEWKLNMDFPTRLIVEAPADVKVAKADQRRPDAVEFVDERGEFKVSFTPGAQGARAFKAQFRFAVCTDETCDPKREELAWVVDVD
jgi:hypothetical protein